jgi:hypothetical protein
VCVIIWIHGRAVWAAISYSVNGGEGISQSMLEFMGLVEGTMQEGNGGTVSAASSGWALGGVEYRGGGQEEGDARKNTAPEKRRR